MSISKYLLYLQILHTNDSLPSWDSILRNLLHIYFVYGISSGNLTLHRGVLLLNIFVCKMLMSIIMWPSKLLYKVIFTHPAKRTWFPVTSTAIVLACRKNNYQPLYECTKKHGQLQSNKHKQKVINKLGQVQVSIGYL